MLNMVDLVSVSKTLVLLKPHVGAELSVVH
jgi:hypothetical protein